MKFLKEVDPEATKYQVRPRCIEFALEKAEEGPYWERLLSEKTKQHWLKVDFGKWKDEDDSDAEGEGGAAGGGDLEEGPYWERLLAEKTKQHWLKVDFGKWK